MWAIHREIDRGTILSALVVAAFDAEPKQREIELEDLSRNLTTLVEKNVVDLSDFDISPCGEYSEDVARFIGNHMLAGYATKRSPLVFSSDGLIKCRKRLKFAFEDVKKSAELKKIAKALQINLDKLDKYW